MLRLLSRYVSAAAAGNSSPPGQVWAFFAQHMTGIAASSSRVCFGGRMYRLTEANERDGQGVRLEDRPARLRRSPVGGLGLLVAAAKDTGSMAVLPSRNSRGKQSSFQLSAIRLTIAVRRARSSALSNARFKRTTFRSTSFAGRGAQPRRVRGT